MMKWEAEQKGYTCNDCYLSMQNCHDMSICCEDETGLCDFFEELADLKENKMDNDLISRKAALDAFGLSEKTRKYGGDHSGYNTMMLYEIQGILEGLPSAQPEQIWILCDEKMPEEHEWIGTKKFGTTISDEVYVTFENEKGERFCKHMTFQNGELSRYDKAYMDAWFKDYKPIAWMPLPEPYMEGDTK